MNKIVECVPNFSEGRDAVKIEKIIAPFYKKKGVKLLDYQHDADHNRLVVTVIGEPESLKESLIESIESAVLLIDMRIHKGQHPRMGAVDVVPFIPIINMDMAESIEISKDVAKTVSEKFNIPVFLYEESASFPARKNLADIRKGQFEGMAEKMKNSEWKPDFGPEYPHPTAGVTAIGARMPLIAFNVNLGTNQIEIADNIARKVRHISGGLRYCKAIGIALKEKNIVQVSINMTDYTKTALYRVLELIRIEAKRYGVNIIGTEIVGIVPMAALIDSAAYYMGLENFSINQIMETRIIEMLKGG